VSTFGVDNPSLLVLLAVIPLLVIWSRRSLAGLGPSRRRLAIGLRSVVLALLALALAGLSFIKKSDSLSVIFVVDQSRSVSNEFKQLAIDYIEEVRKLKPVNDHVGVVFFDGEPRIEWLPAKDIGELKITSGRSPDRTDIGQALRMALALFGEDHAKRIVLISDGNETASKALAEASAIRDAGAVIDIVPIDYDHQEEVIVERLIAPAEARKGQTIDLKMKLSSRKATRGRIRLYHNDQPLDLDPKSAEFAKVIDVPAGPHVEVIQITLETPRIHRFQAIFEPLDESRDQVPENNRSETFVSVASKGRVLMINPAAVRSPFVPDALQSENIEVEVVDPSEIAIDSAALSGYDALILSNVAADQFTAQQQKILASYVHDAGGGMIMIGGADSFGAGGWLGTPIEEAMPVSMEIKQRKRLPRGALVLIMHSCEMPQGQYWGVETAVAAVKAVSRLDYVGVISEQGGPKWQVPLAPASDKPKIINAVKRMPIGDMPDYDRAMQMAYNDLSKLKGDAAQKHIIIITDADPSMDPVKMPALLAKMKQEGITVAGVAVFPHGGNNEFAYRLRDNIVRPTTPEGKKPPFYLINRPGDEKQLPQIFIKEAKTITRSLIREGPPFPVTVKAMTEPVAGIALSSLPPLTGHVLTSKKGRAETPIVSDKGDPILAHWQHGLGKAVAFTSDANNRWSKEWVGWSKFAPLWGQIVRWSMRQSTPPNFEVFTRLEGDEAHVVVEAVDKEGGFLNFLDLEGKVIDPQADGTPLKVKQTGPGRYEGKFPISKEGTYGVVMAYKDPTGEEQEGILRTGVTMPYSPEFRQLSTNHKLLDQIADATDGRRLIASPEADQVFAHNLPPVVSRLPVWQNLLRWFLLLFLIDVAARRVVFDYRAVGKRIGAFYGSIVHSLRPAEASAATVERLKSRRQEVQDEFAHRGEVPEEITAASAEAAPNRRAKFDMAEGVSADRLAEVRQKMTQQRQAEREKETAAGDSAENKGAQSPLEEQPQSLARLRDAKRRARKEMDDQSG
jgi:uncharacterized membrane protein